MYQSLLTIVFYRLVASLSLTVPILYELCHEISRLRGVQPHLTQSQDRAIEA